MDKPESAEKSKRTAHLVFRWDDIPPGTCRIMQLGDKRVAVCKDEAGDKVRIYEVIED